MTILTDGFKQSDEAESLTKSRALLRMGFWSGSHGDRSLHGIAYNADFRTESFDAVSMGNTGTTTRFGQENDGEEAFRALFASALNRTFAELESIQQEIEVKLTERHYRTSNTTSRLIAEGEQILRDTWNRSRHQARIEELIGLGSQEGIKLNKASELDFWSYMTTMRHTRAAGLVLTDDGNLRAVWKDGAESRLAIEFLGERQAEYVIFRRRRESATVSRVAGTDTFEGIRAQIRAFDLGFLVNE